MISPLLLTMGPLGVNRSQPESSSRISLVIGLVMVIVFGYTSDQKAIHVAKDRLKAHLLAVRLFQDQIPVVLRSYGRIVLAHRALSATRVQAFAVCDCAHDASDCAARSLSGLRFRLATGQSFLVKARMDNPDALNEASLQLPDGLATDRACGTRASGERSCLAGRRREERRLRRSTFKSSRPDFLEAGGCRLRLAATFVDPPARTILGAHFRLRRSPLCPRTASLKSIDVQYPDRNIAFAGIEWNWIWLFFVLSLVAGFLFKSILGIEI